MDGPTYSLSRRLAAEAVGTGFLLIAIVGSGIAAGRLSPDDPGLRLLVSALVTAFALMALIWTFGPVSGAHLNPCVTLVDALLGNRPATEGLYYVCAQFLGGVAGTVVANLMFGLPTASWSETARSGEGVLLGEVIATLGLITVIFMIARPGGEGLTLVAPAVGVYIGAAYFFTSSTGFANPAVTLSRMIAPSGPGIAPGSTPGFVAMQLIGAGLAFALVRFLLARQ